MPNRLTIQAMRRLAKSRGGRCLSDAYVNAFSKLLWQCAKGHEWTAKPNNIQQGHWCPTCRGSQKLTIGQMHALAESRGGECLSDVYINDRSKLLWQCARGHRWEAIPGNVRRGHWCPHCHGGYSGRMLTLEDMKQTAASRGGLCLSDEYVSCKTHLIWQCRQGHQWRATPNSVRMGTWCPACYLESTRRQRHGILVEVEARKVKERWTSTT